MKKSEKNNHACCKDGKCKCTEQKSSSCCKSGMSITLRIFCGLVFIAAATLILLQTFGIVTIDINIGILAALTALAVLAIVFLFHLFWAGFFFLVATIITIMNANDIVFSLTGTAIGSLFIAAALASFAFHIIFFSARKKFSKHRKFGHHAGSTFGSATKHFDGELDTASLECNFGGVKAYFEKATLKDNEATLNIDCNFGGVELFVPKSWRVTDKTKFAFGASDEKNRPTLTDSSPTLTITGEINFGGLVITYI